MRTSDERFRKLQTAASLMNFEYGLKASGKTSIYWGIFTLFFGVLGLSSPFVGMVASIKANILIGAVNFLLGAFLIAAGIYQRRSRRPRVFRISAVTLGLLAAWNLGGFILSLLFDVTVGHPLVAGLAHSYGAYKAWRSYGEYVVLLKSTDPAALEETRNRTRELAVGDPNAIKFRRMMTRHDPYWRLKFVDDLVFLVRMGAIFARESSKWLKVREVLWLRRDQLKVESSDDRWSTKDLYATIHLGDGRKEAVRIHPDMLLRLELKA